MNEWVKDECVSKYQISTSNEREDEHQWKLRWIVEFAEADKRHHHSHILLSHALYTIYFSVPPHFTVSLEEAVVAEEGDIVNLTCSASAYPQPVYAWTKSGLTIDGSGQLENHNRSLVLRNVTSADDGLYTCWAVNEAGNVSTATNLTVHGELAAKDSNLHLADILPMKGISICNLRLQ